MPALYAALTGTVETAPHLARRDLTVNHTQAITLGVMAVYVVVIAILWNVPYVRWVLWPFKVRTLPNYRVTDADKNRCWSSHSTNSDTRSQLAVPAAKSSLSRWIPTKVVSLTCKVE